MLADLYIRVSTDEQSISGYSQRYQEEVLKRYCEINSIDIRKVIFEDYSAKTFNRPEWNKLIEEYNRKKTPNLCLLLITKWDRFSRNTGDAYYMIDLLFKKGIEVRAIDQPLDLSIPENKLMMAFFLAAPEVENARRSLSIKDGMARAKKEGRWMGSPPVGYIRKITELGLKYIEPVEPQASIMRKAFQQLATGIYTITHVYQEAVESGLQKGHNCFWKAIRNPVYCGLIPLNPDKHARSQYAIGQHKAIISEHLYRSVQQVLTLKKKKARASNCHEELPLRGFLICPKCGKTLTGSGSKGKSKVYFYYHCISKCGARFRADVVHQELSQLLEKLTPTEYFINVFQKILKEEIQSVSNQNLINQKKAIDKIEKLAFRVNKAQSLLLDGSIEAKEYKSIKRDCETQINILGESLSRNILQTKEIMKVVEDSFAYIFKLKELYGIIDTLAKRELLSSLFPYGVLYTEACFDVNKISNPLQLIYSQPKNYHFNEISASLKHDSTLINEYPRYQVIISDLIRDNKIETLQQAKGIVIFFKKIASLIIDITLVG